ncbi:hypothetical protein GLO73106DRAFT_00040150, partial [Gloeocapsa sp. PCC 73106]
MSQSLSTDLSQTNSLADFTQETLA